MNLRGWSFIQEGAQSTYSSTSSWYVIRVNRLCQKPFATHHTLLQGGTELQLTDRYQLQVTVTHASQCSLLFCSFVGRHTAISDFHVYILFPFPCLFICYHYIVVIIIIGGQL